MIAIEGVVGVGKTSLMEILVSEGYTPFEEPVIDNPILEKFYHNRKRYSFPLQVFFLNRRFEQLREASKLNNVVMDRSIYGDAIFAKLLNENNELSDIEYNIYEELFDNMIQFTKSPKLIVYLEASTDEAIKRINMRGRDYEQEVERDYWENLNHKYNDFFNNYSMSPIIRINVENLDFKNNTKDKEYVVSLIKDKLKDLEENIDEK